MEIAVFEPNNFYQLQESWQKLQLGKDMTIFQSYEWYKWLNNFYKKEKVKNIFRYWIYILVSDKGNPIMIAPIQVVKCGFEFKNIGIARGGYLAGRYGYSDYLNFIYDYFSPEALSLILDYIKELGIKSITFDRVKENTDFFAYISAQYKFRLLRSGNCVVLSLPENFEQYKKLLSKSSRQNIRTAINRQKKNECMLHHELVFDISKEMEKRLMNIREQRLGKKQEEAMKNWKSKIYSYTRTVLNRCFSARQDIFENGCDKWCFCVKDRERIVAFYWGICDKEQKTYYAILAGVDVDYTWYSPAISHFYMFIEELYERNSEILVFDFLRGEEKYKFDLGGKAETINTFRVVL